MNENYEERKEMEKERKDPILKIMTIVKAILVFGVIILIGWLLS